MAADSPNDKRYMLLAFLRPTPICIAVYGAMGGPMPTAVAVFMDRETKSISLVDVRA